MKLMRLQLKRFVNNKILVGIILFVVLAFLIMISVPLINADTVSPLVLLSSTLKLNYIFAVAFMFIAYEYIITLKTQNCAEYFSSLKNGLFLFYSSSIGTVLLILTLFSVITSGINIIFYACNYAVNKEYINQILLNIFLYIFLTSGIFILIGSALTFFKKRVHGYAGMIVVCLFTSPIFGILGTQFHSNFNLNIYPLVDLFDFSTPLVDWTPVYSFGFPVSSYQFQRTGVFVFILTAILLFKLINKQKIKAIVLSVTSLCVSLAFILLYFQPVSKVNLSDNPINGFAADQYYYGVLNAEQKSQPAEFSVSKYKLSLDIDRKLSGVAELYLADIASSELIFTLYHGYTVTAIFDENNNRLKYDRVSDYITVYFKTVPKMITVNYCGQGNRFYSNAQGISLPGYFPFYPQPGFKNLYNHQEMGFEKYEQAPKSLYEVSVKAPKKVFCNLPETAFNTFSGEADSVTLISGLYETAQINGIDIVYPYLFLTENYPQSTMFKEIEGFINNHKELQKIKKIMVVANINNTSAYERMTVYDDYITCTNVVGISESYTNQLLNSEKKFLQNILNLYENVKPAYSQLLLSAKENPDTEQNRLILIFDKKLNSSGDSFLEATKKYINSDSTKTAFDFLSNWEAD
ncbi:MAG: hypothetical protein MJ212_03935 [Alphaproteobacteria bacterium]|nr:hypothetical protein [Alphaproteobacteria bacterium]